MRIFDTHTHYDDEAFDEDRDVLLGGVLAEGGVECVVNMGASMEGAEASVELTERYSICGPDAGSERDNRAGRIKVYAGVGIHPDETGVFEGKTTSSGMHFSKGEDVLQHLRQLCECEGVVCVGEIGLDYHWMVEPKEVQQRWFREQMCLAHELQLPINVHSRDAAKDTFDLIRENYDAGRFTGGIIHCYSGSLELAREYVKMGYHIGIGGVVTFKNAKVLKRVVEEIPLEYLVTETDCPYLAPEPFRGRRNDSRNIRYIIGAVAELKKMDPEVCAERLFRTAQNVYRLAGVS